MDKIEKIKAEIARRKTAAEERVKNVQAIGGVNVADEMLALHLGKLLNYINELEQEENS